MNYHSQGIGPSSSPETAQHTEALIEAQSQFRKIPKTADNPAFRTKYATFEGASEVLLPILTGAGFCLPTYHPGWFGPEMGWCCVGILKHKTGEWTSAILPLINLPQEKRDFKSGEIKVLAPNMQGIGGALTYAKRQLLLALTGAWVGEADDDGNRHVEESRPAVSGMEIESKAGKALAEAKTPEDGQKVLDKVKLRVLEKACPKAVYDRLKKKFDEKFQPEEVTNG